MLERTEAAIKFMTKSKYTAYCYLEITVDLSGWGWNSIMVNVFGWTMALL